MISTFNLEKLSSLLQDFYTVTHIRITVFDENFHEILSYPKERALFCQLIRQDECAHRACVQCDEAACQRASRMHHTYIYRCHAGLTEAITPIYMGNIVIGYLFFGHVFAYDSTDCGWESIQKKCQAYRVDAEELKKAAESMPLMSEEYIMSASHLLHAIASYLCIERMATLRYENLPVQIDNYIQEHLTEDLTADRLCQEFSIGKTKLYEIAKRSYGMGIAEHIRNLRIEKAKTLLREQPDTPISQIAFACGFSDYNYFITVFSRVTGTTPAKYAKSCRTV